MNQYKNPRSKDSEYAGHTQDCHVRVITREHKAESESFIDWDYSEAFRGHDILLTGIIMHVATCGTQAAQR